MQYGKISVINKQISFYSLTWPSSCPESTLGFAVLCDVAFVFAEQCVVMGSVHMWEGVSFLQTETNHCHKDNSHCSVSSAVCHSLKEKEAHNAYAESRNKGVNLRPKDVTHSNINTTSSAN